MLKSSPGFESDEEIDEFIVAVREWRNESLVLSLPAVLLDTDVASAVYKKRPLPILNAISGYEPCISFVTYGEMTKWAEVRSWAPRNRSELHRWLAGVATIHSSELICEVWGHARGGRASARPAPAAK